MFAYDRKDPVSAAARSRPNRTGLPDRLKSGIESMSGISMDYVRVHYNSSAPAQLQARAYAHGTDIHIASGQEKHLPHEAWHVVQQLQGRVKPTVRNTDTPVNDDLALEREADIMGRRAAEHQGSARSAIRPGVSRGSFSGAAQLVKIAPLNPNEEYFSADDFGRYFQNSSNIKDSSWNILKRICFNRLRQEAGEARELTPNKIVISSSVNDAIQRITADFPQLDDLFKLYRELAQVKFVEAPPQQGSSAPQGAARASAAVPQKQWRLSDGSLTPNANTFVQNYQTIFKKKDLVERYQGAIANEINARDYSGSREAQLYYYDDSYHIAPQSIQASLQDMTKNIVLYRAMKPEEYIYLKTYIDLIKDQVDRLYDTGTVGNEPVGESPIENINALYGGYKRTLRSTAQNICPIGAHLGDFEQVASGYLNRAGEEERVVVKFIMKNQSGNRIGSFVEHLCKPRDGGEGPPQTSTSDHAQDMIGAKREANGKFSLNVGTNKWVAFMFMYFVDKIEVLNPSAVKQGEPGQSE